MTCHGTLQVSLIYESSPLPFEKLIARMKELEALFRNRMK